MPDSSEALLEFLRNCTVRFSGASQGTGFFVAPGRILTCAHVVEDMRDRAAPIDIEWDGKPYPATILGYRAKPYPDLALLSVELGAHPCVYLDGAIEVGDPLYSWGYTDQYRNGDSATFEYEGPIGAQPFLKLKLKAGQASRRNNLIKFERCALKRDADCVHGKADRVEVPIACVGVG